MSGTRSILYCAKCLVVEGYSIAHILARICLKISIMIEFISCQGFISCQLYGFVLFYFMPDVWQVLFVLLIGFVLCQMYDRFYLFYFMSDRFYLFYLSKFDVKGFICFTLCQLGFNCFTLCQHMTDFYVRCMIDFIICQCMIGLNYLMLCQKPYLFYFMSAVWQILFYFMSDFHVR